MPGTGDGSSFYNAFEWDHTLYPGGTRVFGQTAQYSGGGLNQYDWWAVTLEAGKTYAIQTRLPTAFNTYLYLYNDQYSYLLYDNDSGDDGYPLSKMVYNCTREAMYVIRVGGSYYYYDYGPYVLECVPAPKGARTFVCSPGRFDIRREAELLHLSRFASIREKNFTAFGNRFTAFAPARNSNANRISARQVAGHGFASRFAAIKLATVVVSAGRFDVRTEHGNRNGVRFSARSESGLILPGRFDVRFPAEGLLIDRFSSQGVVEAVLAARHDSLVPHGWTLYARNADTGEAIRLGFIPADADPKDLADVPLADGVWEIEARPSQWFWNECRGRRIVTLIAGETGSGGGPLQGLPAIQNLRREIVNFQSVIKWKIAAEYEPVAFRFGLWFAPASPVDTSGAPDQIVPYYSGQGDYQAVRGQTDAEYVAVAAFTDDETGPVSELYLPWDTLAPASPPNQYPLEQGQVTG